MVNYVSAEGQSASEKAEEIVAEMLQAGSSSFFLFLSLSLSLPPILS